MRVVVDARTASAHFPGIGRYVTGLASALGQLPVVDLVLLRDPAAPDGMAKIPAVPVADCAVSPFSLAQQWRVPPALRHAGADLYHSPYYLMPYLPGVPAVVTVHDLIPLLYPEYFSAAQRLVFRLAHLLALRCAAVVLAVSEATRRDLVRYFRFDPARIVVTPEAAGPAFTPQAPGAIASVRQEYALPERYLLYAGSNKPHKNLRRLVGAWAALPAAKRNRPQMALAIAGPWDNRYNEARAAAEAYELSGQVRILGPIPEAELPALYSGATAFVFPSLYEGFGLPVLEAMACGTPVICSRAASLPEVASDAALLVDPQDVQAITDAMARVLDDARLREDLCARGLARAGQFSWQRTAQITLTAYQAAAAPVAGR